MDERMKIEISREDRYFVVLALTERVKQYETLCKREYVAAQSKEDFERVNTLRYFRDSYKRALRGFNNAVQTAETLRQSNTPTAAKPL